SDEIEPAVGFLAGEPRQGSVGVGWNTIAKLPPVRSANGPRSGTAAAVGPDDGDEAAPLRIVDVDRALTALADTTGPGSAGRRHEILNGLFGHATSAEVRFLSNLLTGQLRQGALAGVMADAVARAAGVPATVVRRASMLGGRLDVTARVALTEGRNGLEAIGL